MGVGEHVGHICWPGAWMRDRGQRMGRNLGTDCATCSCTLLPLSFALTMEVVAKDGPVSSAHVGTRAEALTGRGGCRRSL